MEKYMSNWYNIGTPYHKFNPDYLYDEELPRWIKARLANGLTVPKKVYARLKCPKQETLF